MLGGEEKELEYGTDAAAAVAGQASFCAVGTSCCWSCSSEFLLNLLDICLLQKDFCYLKDWLLGWARNG